MASANVGALFVIRADALRRRLETQSVTGVHGALAVDNLGLAGKAALNGHLTSGADCRNARLEGAAAGAAYVLQHAAACNLPRPRLIWWTGAARPSDGASSDHHDGQTAHAVDMALHHVTANDGTDTSGRTGHNDVAWLQLKIIRQVRDHLGDLPDQLV